RHGRLDGGGTDRTDDPTVSRQLAAHADHSRLHSAVDHRRGIGALSPGPDLNTMTLGGFALAVGILVDNSTVVIENIERHVGLDKPLYRAIVDGPGGVGLPTFLATLSISVVFFPVFLLTGTAKYLFSPLSLSVIISLCASLVLSFTL